MPDDRPLDEWARPELEDAEVMLRGVLVRLPDSDTRTRRTIEALRGAIRAECDRRIERNRARQGRDPDADADDVRAD